MWPLSEYRVYISFGKTIDPKGSMVMTRGCLIYCCTKCKFTFESIRILEMCPDCGYGPVRRATAYEVEEYAANRRLYGPMQVYGQVYFTPFSEEGAAK